MLNIFLLSSPLQAIVAQNIRRQYLQDSKHTCWVFCEGDRLVTLLNQEDWDEIIVGENTRPSISKAKENIHSNLALLKKKLSDFDGEVTLHVSELFWLFNNVVYSHLKKNYSKYFCCHYFDEGLVIYRTTPFSLKEKMTSVGKYLWLKFANLPATAILENRVKYDKIPLAVYCYHPCLIEKSCQQKSEVYKLNPHILSHNLNTVPDLSSKKTALFLSQPYYRVVPEALYESIIANMLAVFRQRGYQAFYLKPHDADEKKWIEKLMRQYGFELFHTPSIVPIEAFAAELQCSAIVGVCSSALLNLRLFGYKGEVISYGMNHFKQFKHIMKSHNDAKRAYEKVGVEILN